MPKENVIAGEGKGLQDRAGHAEHRPSVAARDLRRGDQVLAEDRPRVGQRAQAVGPAARQARPGGAEDRLDRRHGVRARGDGRRLLPAGRRQAPRLPDRGGDRQALRLRARLGGCRHDGPGPRRTRLRDRRVAGGSRREAGPGRADAARHADQPDLRGLDRDHAPDDRPRGGRSAPARSPATSCSATAASPRRPSSAVKAGAFYAKWFPSLAVGDGPEPGRVRRVRLARQAPALRRALARASWPARRSTRWAATRPSSSRRARCWAGSSTSAPSCTRSPRACIVRLDARPGRSRAQRDAVYELADLFCTQARRRADALFDELLDNDDAAQYSLAQYVLEGRYEFFEHDVVDPAGSGPMIPEHTVSGGGAGARDRETRSADPSVAAALERRRRARS